MPDHQQDTALPLGNAAVTLHARGERHRLRLESAMIIPRGRGRVRVTCEGPQGSVEVNLPREIFERMIFHFQEQSAAAGFGPPPLITPPEKTATTMDAIIEQISANTGILGFGDDLIIKQDFPSRRPGQASMLLESESRVYILDFQLGSADDAQVVRLAERWAAQSRRNPGRRVIAVLAAEEITMRHRNILRVIGNAVPITALRMETEGPAVRFTALPD